MTTREAKAGEEFTGELAERLGAPAVVVAPACENKDGGYWFCLTHFAAFPSNLTADAHEGKRGPHVMGWLCHEHGLEAPK